MNKIIAAAKFAARVHAGQVRKWTGAPYITHPARVACRAILLPNADEDLVCAAWLHDTIEDCGVLFDQLCSEFGVPVGGLVHWLTNSSKGSKLQRADRKKLDRAKLADAPIEAKQIKLLDRIDNLRELEFRPQNLDFCELYAGESELLLEVLRGSSQELADELQGMIENVREQVRFYKKRFMFAS